MDISTYVRARYVASNAKKLKLREIARNVCGLYYAEKEIDKRIINLIDSAYFRLRAISKRARGF